MSTKKRRKAGRPRKENLDERFMVRVSSDKLNSLRQEAKRRGLNRGRDSGVGALARIGLDLMDACGQFMSGKITRAALLAEIVRAVPLDQQRAPFTVTADGPTFDTSPDSRYGRLE